MRILMINSVCGIRSTGRICTDLAQKFETEGHEVKIAYGRVEEVPERFQKYAVRIGGSLDLKRHALRTRLLDEHGFGSVKPTKEFLKWANEYNPDMLWLHNIHGYYLNIEMLFDWIKSRPDMEVRWTLHDCWAFTGHCAHFTVAGCEKWKTGCGNCPQIRRYPASLLKDNSQTNYKRKKNAFTGVQKMTLITPSQWLANLVKQSFLKDYPIEVHYNSIDTNVFKPMKSEFRQQHGLKNKKIVLGVASAWNDRKGLNDFFELRKKLDDSYAIVLVGLSEKQIRKLPEQIVGIPRTNSVHELAQIYTAADVFVNPSREETFGLTTVEAQACGTPAVVYEETACEEVVRLKGGKAVPQNLDALRQAVCEICVERGKGINA